MSAGRPESGDVVLVFDGHCILCNGAVRFAIRRDMANRIRLCHAQSPAGIHLIGGDAASGTDSVIVVSHGVRHVRTGAVVEILRVMGAPWRALARVLAVLPRGLTDAVYDAIARSRYRIFGRTERCPLLGPNEMHRFIPRGHAEAE